MAATSAVVISITLAFLACAYLELLHERPFGLSFGTARFAPLETAEEWAQPDFRNEYLRDQVRHVFPGATPGQETVFIDSQTGVAFVAPTDGFLYSFNATEAAAGSETTLTRLRYIGGRVLGAAVAPGGREVIACDVSRGLIQFRVDADVSTAVGAGEVRLLSFVSSTDGLPVLYCDDVDVDPVTGDAYFSDAMDLAPYRRPDGHYATMALSLVDMQRGGRGTGRLLRYEASTGVTTTLVSNLSFANGVALAADGAFVVVAETFNARLMRHWLRGPQAGQTEVFSLLPCLPDGLSRAAGGGFWVAGPVSMDSRLLHAAAGSPLLRSLLALLPQRWWPGGAPVGLVVRVDARGDVRYALMDSAGSAVRLVTAASEWAGTLFLGQLHGDSVPVVPAPWSAA